ncbi:hypothetical protein KBC55_03060 [Patescibacteria group bacterium]|nr:hypothetical protein [Patescibacteria group bacterium]
MFRSILFTLSFVSLAACGVPSVERVGGDTDDESMSPGNGVVPNDDNVDTIGSDSDEDDTDDETDDTTGSEMTFEVTLSSDVYNDLDGDWEFWVTTDLDGFVFPTNIVEIGDSRILVGDVNLEEGDKFLLNGTGVMDEQFWLVENGDITHISRLEVDNVEYVIDVSSAATTSPAAGTCRIHDDSDHNLICRVGTPDEDEQDEDETDGETSEFCLDDDGDGFGDSDECDMYEEGDEPSDYVSNDDDCDDSDDEINPDADEVDDNVDNDCDGDVDTDDSNCEDCTNGGTIVDVMVAMNATWCNSDQWQVRFHREANGEDDRYADEELAMDMVSTDDVTGELEVEDGEIFSVQAFCDSNENDDPWDDSTTWGVMSGADNFESIEIDGQEYIRRDDRDDTPSAGECTLPEDEDRFDWLCKIDL